MFKVECHVILGGYTGIHQFLSGELHLVVWGMAMCLLRCPLGTYGGSGNPAKLMG